MLNVTQIRKRFWALFAIQDWSFAWWMIVVLEQLFLKLERHFEDFLLSDEREIMEINDSYEFRLRSKLADVVVGFCHNKPRPRSLKFSSYGLRIVLQQQLCHHHHFMSSYTIWILKFNFPNMLISFPIDTISSLIRRVARFIHGSEFRSHCAVSRNVCAWGCFHVASLSPSSPSTIIASNNTERLWCENIYIICAA